MWYNMVQEYIVVQEVQCGRKGKMWYTAYNAVVEVQCGTRGKIWY